MSLKEFIYFNKKKMILFIGCMVIFFIFFLFYYGQCYLNKDKDKNDMDLKKIELDNKTVLEKNDNDEDVNLCFFDIKGEVVKPGVYSIDCNKRIIDAINISGGLSKNSDTSVLNLSKKIEDGMVILVYSKKEVINYLETLEKEEKKQSICDSSNIVNDACNNINFNNKKSLVNINTASLSELMTLSGIGESKAKSIISYREKTPFKNIEDILNVEGIGESIYVNIKENITI